ncbi:MULTISPECIES: YbaB/EbfC family nucleoid-associated protein [unclassified Flavobacterium]|uniref:YbaB/EbfC family nucleoid-associated protein n=1 Tax=unclassified Flavobacterium TaxID=196869 RepID=UPI001F148F70|nr:MULTISPECIES: YbaB/EbfC family nucleoid-associated protein [unclassified Flavobacterium]UMY65080.1 YbaB/EbfC family nucleoid-associated protein [Flavobacterium sp. HJ-32-4]
MFGELMGMMGQLQDAQKRVEATKKRLDTVMVEEKSADGLLSVTITANREIRSVSVNDALLEDKEQLEDYLVLVLNKAIAKATAIHESEVAAAAKEGLPPIPGLF